MRQKRRRRAPLGWGLALGVGVLFVLAAAQTGPLEAGPDESGSFQASFLTNANALATNVAAKATATAASRFYGTAIAAVPTEIWTVQQKIADMQATATTAAIRSQSALSQATREAASNQTNNAFATRAALYQTATAIPATATPLPPTATAANAMGHVLVANSEHLVATVQLGNHLLTATPYAATAEARAAAASATAAEAARIIGSIPSTGQSATSAPAPAAPAPFSGQVSAGQPLQLRGTPHLWFADAFGVLHWGGDTRALAGREINWSAQREISLSDLVSRPIGDPWLSAGLVKIGDPIYLVKWETGQAVPILLHVQSITDVQIFGINANNYGTFVIEAAQWEQTYGIPLNTLIRATLPRAA